MTVEDVGIILEAMEDAPISWSMIGSDEHPFKDKQRTLDSEERGLRPLGSRVCSAHREMRGAAKGLLRSSEELIG